MKIGILAQTKQRKITGVNRVTVGTLTELLKLDKENQYYYIGNTDWLPVKLDTIDVLYFSDGEIPLSYMQASHKLDVIHSHNKAYTLNEHLKCGKVLTIHDMIPYLHPEWNNNNYEYFDGPLRKCAQRADCIIAVSECTKRDAIEAFGIREEKVKVVYNGLYPDKLFQDGDMGREIKQLEQEQFLLSVSAVSANKNQTGLIEAFLNFKERHAGSDLKLVIVGPVRQYQVIREVMDKHKNAERDVIFTGFVSDEELVWLYRKALAFIYVSFYEGFGLPILEALSVGKAVITSDKSSMPEVGGNAAEYCDPYDTESIVHSMERVVFDEDYRRLLESRARDQAAKFTYENAAKQTMEIYRMFG